MGQREKLSLGEFLKDIRLIAVSPARRFALIQERGASWGSMALLLIPTYLAFNFAGGIYFPRDPFRAYSFLPPVIFAVIAVYLKLLLIHVCALLFRPKSPADARPGTFADLRVVFGYTGIPSILALLLATVVFLLIPHQLGRLMLDFKAVGMSVMIALAIALFVWNLILVVLALRTVYRMRDIRIVGAFILGSALTAIPAFGVSWIVATPKVNLAYVRPILSDRILRFFASDPTSDIAQDAKISVHVDRLAFRLREPERFELVAFSSRRPASEEKAAAGSAESPSGIKSAPGKKESEPVVGRVVGLPGDTVELVNGRLRINGVFWDERYLTPEQHADFSLAAVTLGPSEFLVLPENRNLIRSLEGELKVNRDQILGREVLAKWPLGWFSFRPGIFLAPEPVKFP